MVKRVPFNIVDEWIFHLDQEPEPWSVHCEVRVPGRLDADRVAAATRAAAAKHPMVRARMASSRYWDRGYCWEIADGVDHVPLEIVDCADDAALANARDRLQSMHVSLGSSPPVALTLAHHPAGDSLIMNLHHAAGDGVSAYRLMTSIARAYAGVHDPLPENIDPLAVRDLRRRAGSRSVRGAMVRARHLKDRLSEARSEGAATRVTAERGLDGAEGYHFQLLRLGHEETEAVMARRRRPATVNDLLVAALAIAIAGFNSERGAPTGRIGVMMPVSLRPSGWSEEVVGNILSFVSVSVLESERSDLATAQLAVEARTRALKQRRLSGTMIDVMGMSRVWPVGFRHYLARSARYPVAETVVDTALVSNLGKLAVRLDFGEGAGAARDIWFSPPAQMPLGTAVGAVTVDGEMFLTLRYCTRQYDAAGAAALVARWREVLLGV